jgi:hypothetical protein
MECGEFPGLNLLHSLQRAENFSFERCPLAHSARIHTTTFHKWQNSFPSVISSSLSLSSAPPPSPVLGRVIVSESIMNLDTLHLSCPLASSGGHTLPQGVTVERTRKARGKVRGQGMEG